MYDSVTEFFSLAFILIVKVEIYFLWKNLEDIYNEENEDHSNCQ